MPPWDSFNHDPAYIELRSIARHASSLGAEVGSCGVRKLTLRWPDGRTVHIKRFLRGRFRWLLFTEDDFRAIFLAHRDPNPFELRRAQSH